jgi:anti-sigma B factor antagonist
MLHFNDCAGMLGFRRNVPYSKGMETIVERLGDVQILHPRGRLDLTAVAEFSALIQGIVSEGGTKIIVDCRDLQYVSSSGLGTFISGGRLLGPNGKLVFAELNRHVQSVFEMTGIANLFQVCGSKEDALKHLSGQ